MHPGSKWRVMKPWQVHTSRLHPKFKLMKGYTEFGVRAVDNPWWDLGWVSGGNSVKCINGIQHCFSGTSSADVGGHPDWRVVVKTSNVCLLRGFRCGQAYQ
ncbi:hypothetical protein BaRGS_00003440 [Batillaria attramentaria]|uniref:Uncharacterized protein n=1 Tax=Batillaria attramentaria TaxID=370345 RepID=A0ABD0M1U4_9CAEN